LNSGYCFDNPGELGAIRSWLLNRTLARDPDARQFAEDANRFIDAARAWQVPSPRHEAAELILARARRISDTPECNAAHHYISARILRPTIAGALALLLIALLITHTARQSGDEALNSQILSAEYAWDAEFDEELEAFSESVSLTVFDDDANDDALPDEEQLILEWLALKGVEI
jgi:hypothetical protein